MREEGKGRSYIKTWWNSNKSIIEMNVQPLLPSTTPLVIVAEWREKTDLGLMTQEKSFMGGKSECFNASYVNCHLTGPNFSNTIDSWWWKDPVCLRKRKTRRALRAEPCESRSLPAPTAPLRTTNPMSFPCSCHHLHTANPRGLTLPALQSPPYQSAETLTTHQSTWTCFFFYKMVWLLYFLVSIFFISIFFFSTREKPQFRWCQPRQAIPE